MAELHQIFMHVAYGRGLVHGVAVLWMTSCFHTTGPTGQNEAKSYV